MKQDKIRTLQTVLLIAACIVMFFVLTLTSETYFHDPKQISLKVDNVESRSDESTYYVYMDCTINNGSKKELSALKAEIIFKDKSGNEIGRISSLFGGGYGLPLRLKKGDKQTITTYISEKKGESDRDRLFWELYENGLSNVKVDYEITNATWSDDKKYSKGY